MKRGVVLSGVVGLWFACVLSVGAVGGGIGLAIPCEMEGFGCLGLPIGGAGLGGLLGAVTAGVVAAVRWSVRWWWVPLSLVLVALAVVVGNLSTVLAWTIALAAPLLAGLTALPRVPGTDGADTGTTTAPAQRTRPAPWWGLVALTVAGALVAAAVFAVQRRDRAMDIEEVEQLGLPVLVPAERDDLRVTTVAPAVSGASLTYVLAMDVDPGTADTASLTVNTRRGGGGCTATSLRPCEELDGGVSVYRQPGGDHVVVFRDVGQATVRLRDSTGGGSPGWTVEQMVQVATELEHRDAAWLIDQRDSG